jgi:hypothetical protein
MVLSTSGRRKGESTSIVQGNRQNNRSLAIGHQLKNNKKTLMEVKKIFWDYLLFLMDSNRL